MPHILRKYVTIARKYLTNLKNTPEHVIAARKRVENNGEMRQK